jgi:hypothetical protein
VVEELEAVWMPAVIGMTTVDVSTHAKLASAPPRYYPLQTRRAFTSSPFLPIIPGTMTELFIPCLQPYTEMSLHLEFEK